MLGRGVDQILPNPLPPWLQESYLRDAREYVALAEAVNGPIPVPVDFTWPWGSALATLDAGKPDARLINLETTITRSEEFAPGKPVCYRMSPDNAAALEAGRPDLCVLANNHALDFGRKGLRETIRVLDRVGVRWAGAGHHYAEAAQPVPIPVRGGGRVLVLASGAASSGVPARWAATADLPGVHFLADLADDTASAVASRVTSVARQGDITIVSLHWGSNWGYAVDPEEVRFARRLIDSGVHVVHGHSSHHPRPIEVYRGKLILYGCGDFIDDYEGISGYERYRDDLRLLYFASIDPATGTLAGLRMPVVQARQLRLRPAPSADVAWLRSTMERISSRFGTHFDLDAEGSLSVRVGSSGIR